jgi:hypothetical protein
VPRLSVPLAKGKLLEWEALHPREIKFHLAFARSLFVVVQLSPVFDTEHT